MFISDGEIKKLNESLIVPFSDKMVGAVSYDLTAEHFHRVINGENKTETSIELKPFESAFVSCKEVVQLPSNLTGIVNIRNSRLRQGLSLESPIYYPGHHTRIFFRLTNISSESITLTSGEQYAAIYFVRVDGEVNVPYINKTFSDEFNFKGMGDYTEQYKESMRQVTDKIKDIKSLEKGIYANVMILMTIFVALFSIININVNLVREGTANNLFRLLVFNLGTVGSITALIACAQSMFKDRAINNKLLCISGICFIVSMLLAMRF